MTLRLMRGAKRRNQAGFSLMELLGVILIIGILIGCAGYGFTDSRLKDQFRTERAAQRLITKIDEVRSQAKAGFTEFEKRSIDLREFNPGPQVEWVREMDTQALPAGDSLLQPTTILEFEQQSGRTVNRVHGVLVMRDTVTGKMVAIRIGYPYSPTARYVRQPGAHEFQITSNAIR